MKNDKSLREEIDSVLSAMDVNYYWFRLPVKDSSKVAPDQTLDGLRCYGVFDDCVVLFFPGMLRTIQKSEIAGIVFSHATNFTLWGYHDGELRSLEEMYQDGLITQEEIAKAAEVHLFVENHLYGG